jgi:hypothetical protein
MSKADATVEEIGRGELRLPEMQREYVWQAAAEGGRQGRPLTLRAAGCAPVSRRVGGASKNGRKHVSIIRCRFIR